VHRSLPVLVLLGWLLLGVLPARAQEAPLAETPVPDDPAPFIIPGMGQPAPAPAPAPMQTAPVPPPAPLPLGTPGMGAPRVFLAPFQSYDPALNAEAARLTQVVQIHMLSRYNLATIDQVPPWPDYSALVYLLACPQGQYAGCALVCGNRVAAEWSVGATVTPGLHGVNATLSFVENASAREAISFGVALHGNNDVDLLRAIDTLLGKLMAGAFAAVDIRAAEVDPVERAKLEAARNQVLAESLAELERQQGAVDREILQATEPEKIDKETLSSEYKGREEVKPWEKVGLSEAAYVRYKNSGLPIDTWRDLAQGRAGALIFRAALGGGSGPFGQQFDGRYAIDDDLERAGFEQFQFVAGAGHVHVDLEAGIGILPFLDVTAHYAFRNSQFNYLVDQQRIGSVIVVENQVQNAYSTWQAGGRIAVVPMPVKAVRPAMHVGVAYWQGSSWDLLLDPIQDLEPMAPMNQVLLQLGGGVEITAGRNVSVFGRGLVDLTMAGQTVQRLGEGAANLEVRADPSTFRNTNAGFSIQGGLTFRLRLLGEKGEEPEDRPATRFDDDDLDL
jgi:hypothetical protein